MHAPWGDLIIKRAWKLVRIMNGKTKLAALPHSYCLTEDAESALHRGQREFRTSRRTSCSRAGRPKSSLDLFLSLDPHPRRPRGSQSGREKRRDERFQVRAKEPLGTDSHRTISKNSSRRRLLIVPNALYYCIQSANSSYWVLFVSSYTTAIVSITACLAHAPKKCTQSGNFQFNIKSLSDFKILSARKLKTLFQ